MQKTVAYFWPYHHKVYNVEVCFLLIFLKVDILTSPSRKLLSTLTSDLQCIEELIPFNKIQYSPPILVWHYQSHVVAVLQEVEQWPRREVEILEETDQVEVQFSLHLYQLLLLHATKPRPLRQQGILYTHGVY